MSCSHLKVIEDALISNGFEETFRGIAWSKCEAEWVYFDVALHCQVILEKFDVDKCVEIHENRDPRTGTERGFICKKCGAGIMGKLGGLNGFPR